MGNLDVLHDIINEKLYSVHTAFIGKIVSISGNKETATVQPLNKVKQYGKTAQKQAVIPNVPILYNARYKLKPYKLRYCTGNDVIKELETVERIELVPGDVVFCVCADRDITDTKNGKMATPSVGRHHDMSDAIIVGCL